MREKILNMPTNKNAVMNRSLLEVGREKSRVVDQDPF